MFDCENYLNEITPRLGVPRHERISFLVTAN